MPKKDQIPNSSDAEPRVCDAGHRSAGEADVDSGSMMVQTDEVTVKCDEGYLVTIADEHTVRYSEDGKRLDFEISLQCCGGIQFVMHTYPPPEHWNREAGEERVPVSEVEYKRAVERTKRALEYLKLDFAVD